MTDSPSNALGALCDVPFSPINWNGYDDIQSSLVGNNETAELNLLSLPIFGQEFAATHRTEKSDETPVSLRELLTHLGVKNYEIVTDRGVRTMEELRSRKTVYIMNIDTIGGIHIDDISDTSKDFGEEISRISFGNGNKPFVLLFGEKPVQTSPAVFSLIKLIRKLTGMHLAFFPR